jgi:hypothetical protein
VLIQNNFEKTGASGWFTIGIYYDSRTYESQICTGIYNKCFLFVYFCGCPRQATDVLQPTVLFVPPALDVPTLATRCPHAYRRVPHSSGGIWNLWAENKDREFCLSADFHGTLMDLLHAANLRHGTHDFISLPKEGVLRFFPPLKIRRLRPGLNPRTWVPEASTLTPRPPKPL